MLRWYVRFVAIALFLVGLAGFSLAKLPNVVQLDLFQSFVYLILGGIGLKLGFSAADIKTSSRYARATGLTGFILLGLGLTFPNLFDLFHLEVPEHIWHGVLGLTGSVIGEHYGKQNN